MGKTFPGAFSSKREGAVAYTAKVVRDLRSLQNYLPDMESLSQEAAEPNPSYEPWALVPAMRNFGETDPDVMVVLIFSVGATVADRNNYEVSSHFGVAA